MAIDSLYYRDEKQEQREQPKAVEFARELAYSAAYTGVQAPITAIGQIADKTLDGIGISSNIAGRVTVLPAPTPEEFGTANWHAQQIGSAAGMIIPFAITRGALRASGLTCSALTDASILAPTKLLSAGNAALVADGAIAGFASEFIFRPVDQHNQEHFWDSRAKQGVVGAATFGVLSGSSVAVRNATKGLEVALCNMSNPSKLVFDTVTGAVVGIPAGIAAADANAMVHQGRSATAEERLESAYSMAVAGGALKAARVLPGAKAPVEEAFVRKFSTQPLSATWEHAWSTFEGPAYPKQPLLRTLERALSTFEGPAYPSKQPTLSDLYTKPQLIDSATRRRFEEAAKRMPAPSRQK